MRRQDMDALIAAIGDAFDKMGGLRRHIHISRYPRDAIGAVNRYVRNLPAKSRERVRVYAVGGDGILFDCLNAAMCLPGAELGAMPYGHVNAFVHSFGDGVEGAFRDIAAMARAPSIPTDVILCNGNYAINYCLIGIEAVLYNWVAGMERRFSRLKKIIKALNRGFYNYIAAFGVIGRNLLNQHYIIDADGERIDGQYSAIHIANGPSYGKSMTTTGASLPDDGVLEVVTGRMSSSLSVFRYYPALCNGKHTGARYRRKGIFTHRLARELEITSGELLSICLDGEVFSGSLAKIRVIPGGARIIAPDGLRYVQRLDNEPYAGAPPNGSKQCAFALPYAGKPSIGASPYAGKQCAFVPAERRVI